MASLTSRLQHSVTPNALRSYCAEFLSTFIFVFAAAGAAMSTNSSSLVAVAFALSVAVYISANIFGGHVNLTVTFGMVIRGHISILMSIFYWISQMLGSVMACLLLKFTNQKIPTHGIPQDMTGFGAAVLEGVMTIGLV